MDEVVPFNVGEKVLIKNYDGSLDGVEAEVVHVDLNMDLPWHYQVRFFEDGEFVEFLFSEDELDAVGVREPCPGAVPRVRAPHRQRPSGAHPAPGFAGGRAGSLGTGSEVPACRAPAAGARHAGSGRTVGDLVVALLLGAIVGAGAMHYRLRPAPTPSPVRHSHGRPVRPVAHEGVRLRRLALGIGANDEIKRPDLIRAVT